MARKRSSSQSRTPLLIGLAVTLLLLAFAGGEAWRWARADTGRILIARHLHLGDRAHTVRLIGKRVREGLAAAKVPDAAVTEETLAGGDGPALRWRVALPSGGAPLQANYAITRMVEAGGAVVLSARERRPEPGVLEVVMRVGLPDRPTHEIVLHRGAAPAADARDDDPAAPAGPAPRIAVLVTGLGADPALTQRFMDSGIPVALAVPATGPSRRALLQVADRAGHEVVLLVPMEPEHYPKVNPGPGTLRVDMPPRRVESEVLKMSEGVARLAAVANLMGSFAAQDDDFMGAVYDALKRQDLPFLHLTPPARSVCRALASRVGVQYAEADATLDPPTEARARKRFAKQWAEVLERATRRGQALVVLEASAPAAQWLESLRGAAAPAVEWVPPSAVLRRPAAL
jgi:hypothetical protein